MNFRTPVANFDFTGGEKGKFAQICKPRCHSSLTRSRSCSCGCSSGRCGRGHHSPRGVLTTATSLTGQSPRCCHGCISRGSHAHVCCTSSDDSLLCSKCHFRGSHDDGRGAPHARHADPHGHEHAGHEYEYASCCSTSNDDGCCSLACHDGLGSTPVCQPR